MEGEPFGEEPDRNDQLEEAAWDKREQSGAMAPQTKPAGSGSR